MYDIYSSLALANDTGIIDNYLDFVEPKLVPGTVYLTVSFMTGGLQAFPAPRSGPHTTHLTQPLDRGCLVLSRYTEGRSAGHTSRITLDV